MQTTTESTSANTLAQSVGDRTISIGQATAAVGVTRRTIYNWMKAGKVRYLRTAGGSVRIYESSLWRDGQQ
jgi:excisionase family DNA binding protein